MIMEMRLIIIDFKSFLPRNLSSQIDHRGDVIRQSPQQTKVCTPKLRIDKYYLRTFGVQPLGCLFL